MQRLAAMTLAVVLVATPLAAEDELDIGRGNGGGTILVHAERTHVIPGGKRTEAPGHPPVHNPPVQISVTQRSIVYTRPNGVSTELLNQELRDFCRGTADYSTCYAPYDVERPRRRRQPPPPPPPELIAERTIVNLPLPVPEPEIDPGYAITGLRAYLETGDARRRTWESVDTVLGPLRVEATSTYTVDWGDGTTTGPHSSTGGEYPDGDITHVYQRTRVVDVTVTQGWTAPWSLAGRTGIVDGLVTTGTIEDMAVREVQATRDR